MQFNKPKNTEKYFWTEHSVYKMRQYGLSAQRILRVIRAPFRKEEGIVKNTIAVMQPNKPVKHTSEIWVMYQTRRAGNSKSNPAKAGLNPKIPHPSLCATFSQGEKRIKIISAWRYPGVSPKRNPIPEDILSEIENII
ncbi:MAG: hypothetical protein NTZ97_03075 [Candidatus Moranbacteria bacterium]|nr:hypothetical protein [Candidatus Moranbacteria bacterium]